MRHSKKTDMTTVTPETTEARCRERVGKRVFISYQRADGHLTKREVKVIKVTGDGILAWCEKRDAMRQFKFRGIREFVPLEATEFYGDRPS